MCGIFSMIQDFLIFLLIFCGKIFNGEYPALLNLEEDSGPMVEDIFP